MKMSCSKFYVEYDWSVDNEFDDLFITQKTPEHYNGDCPDDSDGLDELLSLG